MPARKASKPKSPVKLARGIHQNVKYRLIASTAGLCEFGGCNRDLFRHPVTADIGNYAENAHIVAFKPDGPRGTDVRPNEINSFGNLMLLCAPCHKLVDDNPLEFPVARLREFKQEHEERIETLTRLGPEYRTTLIQLRATIGGQPVDIPATDIRTALAPRYPTRFPGLLIDLTGIQRESAMFFDLARDQIKRELRPALKEEYERKRVQHYSVFALAPIPVLVSLGRELGNKLTIDAFQRHRDQTWKWRETGKVVEYECHEIQKGREPERVALLISLSGKITPQSIPDGINGDFTKYEIAMVGQPPGVEFLNQREDLAAFRKVYRDTLTTISGKHGHLRELHLFLAVPAPVALACGMDVMPKAHPALIVYDNVKGKFQQAITINREEDL